MAEADAGFTPPQDEGIFDRMADWLSQTVGSPHAFLLAGSVVVVWALLGPVAGFSNTWQLIINTGTTIVTFLMVFLLGNASNRITENQDRMLAKIYDQEEQLDVEERLIQTLLERIDARHIRPILNHLNRQDDRIEVMVGELLAAVRERPASGA